MSEYEALLVERFGTVAALQREARRLPPPRELARRRRVLAVSLHNHRDGTESRAA